MTISLPDQKIRQLKERSHQMFHRETTTVRDLACLLGMMVAAHPAILPAPIHYRHLERTRSRALAQGKPYETEMRVDQDMRRDLEWWMSFPHHSNGRPLLIDKWDVEIESDASGQGWGAVCQGASAGGPWTSQEKEFSINHLELLASFLALKSFVAQRRSISVLLRLDNITAIASLNKMGGTHSRNLSDLAIHIWNWCLERKILIHAEHLPGSENIQADWHSRHTTDSSDWRLRREIFLLLEDRVGPFTIDLFASRTSAQMIPYCSWRPDPFSMAVDALSIPWKGHYPYAFPPFALISRFLAKLREEEVSATLIAPVWSNQIWFPQLLHCLVDLPILLPPSQDILTNSLGQHHPLVLEGHLPLAAWIVSGKHAMQLDFQEELLRSSGGHGDPQLNPRTQVPGGSGIAGVLDGIQIHFQPL